MALRAGKLQQEITIQQRGETRDKIGASVPSWTTYATTYCEINNLSGAELVQAAQVNSFINSSITIRPDTGVRASMRILYKSRQYNIEFVNDVDERDDTMILLCRRAESVTNG